MFASSGEAIPPCSLRHRSLQAARLRHHASLQERADGARALDHPEFDETRYLLFRLKRSDQKRNRDLPYW